ncbi:NAD(P)/FAD-dependent oxidoreductase [Oceanicoccus sp. KOV_DT_Chl]|uniref:NAD(P)/FAD-dependent oxidoreductase n=1 Tax=Oceanicoccus sp. KOV_DT_Chl TaxID=1904639 RepID=UPI00190E8D10|nr:NAD(P)/FAD-dependent oxidoreductase [Oceanicoccus sp. KOV_DT_Chl]
MAKIAVVGAGPMGLTVSYRLLKMGHQVTLFEADSIIGGMSASFDFDGVKIERFYHFLCRSDYPLFDLLRDLGIEESLRWQDTYMGYYWKKATRDWGDPFALLRFPDLSLLSKVRYGLMAFTSTKRSNWKKLDGVDAVSWLKNWVGQEAYDVLWKPLFELKFHQYTDNLSAAWIWSRLKRVGSSRRHLLQESLGYLDGGSDTFLYRIKDAIEDLSGDIRLSTPVKKITINNGKITGINTEQGYESFDRVVSTVPLPYVPDMLEDLPETTLERYRSVENIAVVCVLAKLKKPLSKYFWLNVSDETMDIPGVVEYTRLRP